MIQHLAATLNRRDNVGGTGTKMVGGNGIKDTQAYELKVSPGGESFLSICLAILTQYLHVPDRQPGDATSSTALHALRRMVGGGQNVNRNSNYNILWVSP